jgi:hypothetical protein
MVITPRIIKELEHTNRKSFPEEFKQYLLMKYAEEPFPNEFSEQDLFTNIQNDIRDYEAGKLDITVKSPSECWLEECEYLQNLCIEKSIRIRDLEDYILELEHMLAENNLESSRMEKQRADKENRIAF